MLFSIAKSLYTHLRILSSGILNKKLKGGFKMNISEKVQELLKSKKCKGMGQNEIAEKIGISPSVLSKLCSGNSKAPSADTVLAIAKYFNVSTDWLLGLSDNPTTDKATKSLCKTLGLSDVAVFFLKDENNQNIRDVINFLFGLHYDFCEYQSDLEKYIECTKSKKDASQILKRRNFGEISLDDCWKCKSIIYELSSFLDICKLKKEIIIDFSFPDKIKLVSRNGENVQFASIDDINTNTDIRGYAFDIPGTASLSDLLVNARIENIDILLSKIFEISQNKNVYSHIYNDFAPEQEEHPLKSVEYYLSKKRTDSAQVVEG